jgi:hypothetical protein
VESAPRTEVPQGSDRLSQVTRQVLRMQCDAAFGSGISIETCMKWGKEIEDKRNQVAPNCRPEVLDSRPEWEKKQNGPIPWYCKK